MECCFFSVVTPFFLYTSVNCPDRFFLGFDRVVHILKIYVDVFYKLMWLTLCLTFLLTLSKQGPMGLDQQGTVDHWDMVGWEQLFVFCYGGGVGEESSLECQISITALPWLQGSIGFGVESQNGPTSLMNFVYP